MIIREFLNSILLGLSEIDSGALAAIYQRLPGLRFWVTILGYESGLRILERIWIPAFE